MRRWSWTGFLLIALTFLGLALTANRWWPALLDFLNINKDSIEALDALVSIISVLISGLFAFLGILGLRKAQKEPRTAINFSTQTGGVGDIIGNDTTVIAADTVIIADHLLQAWKQPPKVVDLRQPMIDYLNYLKDRHRYLGLIGMGFAERFPLKLPLLDLYIPLKARREIPEGETWSNEVRLAGRLLGEGLEGGLRLSEPQPVLDLLQQSNGLIILGDPGAGKTTFLKFLTLKLAIGEGVKLGLGERLPILLPLAAYALALDKQDVRLDDFIVQYAREIGFDLPMGAILTEALRQGAALILLDGLDEVHQVGLRRMVVERVVDFYTFHRRVGNKFVLTSRIVGYHEVQPSADGLVECTLTDFTDEDIGEFVQRWTTAIEQQAQGDTDVARKDAQELGNELLFAIRENQSVRRLAVNPLLLTILALMKRQEVKLPERRVELYNKYVETLLSIWERARSLLARSIGRDIDWIQDERILAHLALWMHTVSSGAGLVPEEEMRRELMRLFKQKGEADPEMATRMFLQDVHDITSLLLERGPGQYGFIHLTFEEYLAAGGIALQSKGAAKPVLDLISEHVGQQEWHEVSLLAIGYLGIRMQLPDVAGQVVEGLIKQRPGQPGEAVVLAGEAVCDAWPGGVPLQSKERVIAALVETVGDQAVTARVRFTAGELLGRMGDPRPGVCLPLTPVPSPGGSGGVEIPCLDWVHIPAGPFLMGSPEGLENTYPDESPQHTLELPDFYISRYPVTNAQFRPFVEGDGYKERRYWTEEGWDWRQGKNPDLSMIEDEKIRGIYQEWLEARPAERRDRPYWWGAPQWGASNRPVVGISWYEALAYCRWLEEQLVAVSSQQSAQEGLDQVYRRFWQRLGTGELRLCLSSEVEWEKAARGAMPSPPAPLPQGEGRVYPWGDQPDGERANTKETGLEQTSAVGIFPGGVSPYGVYDLVGNTWEWTRSRWGSNPKTPDFGYPYDTGDGREDLSSLDFRILRGGSFFDEQSLARCGCRYWYVPVNVFSGIGFRMAASLAVSES